MKNKKIFIVVVFMVILLMLTGCSKTKENIEEEPYVQYIVTTYNNEGDKIMDTFEVYSNMKGEMSKHYVIVYDSTGKETLFYSNLKYTVKTTNN